MELVLFGLSLGQGRFMGDGTGMGQELAVAQLQKIVEFDDPVAHGHRFSTAGLQLGEIQVSGDNQVQRFDFLMGQVVLGDDGVRAPGTRAGPQVVIPIFGLSASARLPITSAAVWPCAAQCILFWTTAKNFCEASALGS